MFQHTGLHIKRSPVCCPDSEGLHLFRITPDSAVLKGGVSTGKEVFDETFWAFITQISLRMIFIISIRQVSNSKGDKDYE
ncbi:hypothetical protein CGZ65_07990 [Neisseria weixii]|nr:hypothetical protein CGZ65_07990 [Neisseria weixii]